jgi:hypothetical protein
MGLYSKMMRRPFSSNVVPTRFFMQSKTLTFGGHVELQSIDEHVGSGSGPSRDVPSYLQARSWAITMAWKKRCVFEIQ